MTSWTKYEEALDRMYLAKEHGIQRMQANLMKGCGNCGSPIQTRKALSWLDYSEKAEYDWNEWRCLDPDCPESLEWHDIFEESVP